MAFNPRNQPPEEFLRDPLEREARREVGKDFVLKPIPETTSILGKLMEYYIRITKKDKTVSGDFNTRNVKHVLLVIVGYGYDVQYLKRNNDEKIILDQR